MKKKLKLYLTWKEPTSRKRFLIGLLEQKEKMYTFRYLEELNQAREKGFHILDEFSNQSKTYESSELFLTFSNRLPNKKRKDFKQFLKERYLREDISDFEILKETRGVLATDTLELLEVLPKMDKDFYLEFYLVGTRHYLDTFELEKINLNTKIKLVYEPKNEHDKYAIFVEEEGTKKIGYLPNCYSKQLYRFIEKLEIKIINIVKSGIGQNPLLDIKIGIKKNRI